MVKDHTASRRRSVGGTKQGDSVILLIIDGRKQTIAEFQRNGNVLFTYDQFQSAELSYSLRMRVFCALLCTVGAVFVLYCILRDLWPKKQQPGEAIRDRT